MSSPSQEAIPDPPVWMWGDVFRRMHPTQRLAIFFWVSVVGVILGRVAFSAHMPPSVVPVYFSAAYRWLAGEDLYEFKQPWDVYRYPPCFAPSFVPFTSIPIRLGELLWRTLSIAIMITGLRNWALCGWRMTPGQRGALFLLTLPLCLNSLGNGQVNILLLGLLLHGASAAIRLKGALSGFCVALATAIKVYPIALGLLFACVLPKRIIPWLALSIGGLLAFPFLLAPAGYVAGQYVRFAESVGADTRREADHPYPPRDLYLVMRNYMFEPSERMYTIIVLAVAAGMAMTVGITALRKKDPRVALILAFDLGCVWMTVFGPATEPSTYALLAPTAAACVIFSRSSLIRFTPALCSYLLLIAPVVRDFFPNGRAFHNMGIQPLGGLLLLGVLLLSWCTNEFLHFSRRGRGTIKVCDPSIPNLSAIIRQ